MKLSNKHILLVEDDETLKVVLTRVLEAVGYQLDYCGTVKDALEKLKDKLPDLIILDLFLPGADGFAFLKVRKMNVQISAVPILVLTGAKKKEEIERAQELGVTQVLLKPFVAKLVLKKIEELFADRDEFVYQFAESESLVVEAELNTEVIQVALRTLKVEGKFHLAQGCSVCITLEDYQRRNGKRVIGKVDNHALEAKERLNRAILHITGMDIGTKRNFENWQRGVLNE